MAGHRKEGKSSLYDNEHNPVVGIDLGTTYSCIARWDGRNPEIYQGLDKVENKPEIPSVVYQEESGNIIVGSIAYRRYLADPANGVVDVKREMGNPNFTVAMQGNSYSPSEVSALILARIREEVYGKFPAGKFSFGGAVVTHPFYFKGPQIADTAQAAEKAGLNLLGLVPEPVAAALAYTLYYLKDHLEPDKPEMVMVFDLGGGTFDTTLFELKETKDKLIFKGIATGGDARLGGMDFNRALMDYVLVKEGLNLASVPKKDQIRAKARLVQAVDVLKRDFSVLEKAALAVPDVLPGRHIDREMSRDEFEKIFKGEEGGRNFYQDLQDIVRETLNKGRNPGVNRVLLVGGSTRIPWIKTKLLPEVLPQAEIYSNISESLAVGLGAAIYAAHLDGRLKYFKEIEITAPGYAHDLGIKTNDGRFARIIRSNAPLPATYSQVFITPEDNCRLLSIEIYEGDAERVDQGLSDGRLMKRGRIEVDGLPAHRKGEVEVVIRFTVARSDQIGVHIEVYQRKQGQKTQKIREIDEDLQRGA
jgi:molecular chaperone DnaK (HSP70)